MAELSEDQKKGLAILRKPFPAELISKKPQGTKAQNECPPDQKKNCSICGGWHHPRVVHLDYVGHAAVTDRLLDADPAWNWEPMEWDESGVKPKLDANGGMWGKLTVCGVTRLGYGDAFGKTGPNAIKELIGDFIRNAAMRFGVAVDCWSKADLHKDERDGDELDLTADDKTNLEEVEAHNEADLAIVREDLQKDFDRVAVDMPGVGQWVGDNSVAMAKTIPIGSHARMDLDAYIMDRIVKFFNSAVSDGVAIIDWWNKNKDFFVFYFPEGTVERSRLKKIMKAKADEMAKGETK